MVIVRTRGGKFQMQRAQPGKLTREAEQHFLATLGTTCNVKLSAAAVDASEGAFLRRRRRRPGFDEAMREAIEAGYDHLEAELIRSAIELLRGGGAAAADGPGGDGDDGAGRAQPARPSAQDGPTARAISALRRPRRVRAAPKQDADAGDAQPPGQLGGRRGRGVTAHAGAFPQAKAKEKGRRSGPSRSEAPGPRACPGNSH